MAQLKYPIGIQNFSKLREEGCVYVDKTQYIHKLVEEGQYIFLSRPRRFGKSLLLSTIEAFFNGRKDLFDGLYISRQNHDWKPRPVLHLDFTGNLYNSLESFKAGFNNIFERWESLYGNEKKDRALSERFEYIIRQANAITGEKVVILIDEYDKPLLDSVDNIQLQDQFRDELKAIYGNLKKLDEYIKFAMLTGVTRFGKLSIFSDLNNLQDISLDGRYSCICGMTREEIDENFKDGVENLAARNSLTLEGAYEELKLNYDGYHFAPGAPDIYNPFSILNALSRSEIESYWFSSGTPTFLVKMVKDSQMELKEINHTEIDLSDLSDVSLDLSKLEALLYQSGYLTIKGYNKELRSVTLGYPNREVEQGFLKSLMSVYTANQQGRSEFSIFKFVNDIRKGNAENFMMRLQSLFSSYQYDQIDTGNLELHYRNVIYLLVKLLGFYTKAEMQTASGRIDLVITTDDYIYICEFKLNSSAEKAISQLNEKDYLLPFKADSRQVIKIGANFSSDIRSIDSWIIETE